MKKQILSLILSTAIFTTSPLFAMDTDALPDGFLQDRNQPHTIKASQIRSSLQQNVYEHTVYGRGFCFEKNNKRYMITNTQSGPDHLELLPTNATVTFSWKRGSNKFFGDVDHFGAEVIVFSQSGLALMDLSSNLYKERAHIAFGELTNRAAGTVYVSNYFKIIEL